MFVGSMLPNNYCLSFGMIIISIVTFVFSLDQAVKFKKQIQQINNKIETDEELDDAEILGLVSQTKQLKKMHRYSILGGCAVAIIMLILGIFCF